jgi:AcrR family transcriptional regulator
VNVKSYNDAVDVSDALSDGEQAVDNAPRWRRRAGARPSEIADAALDVFAAKGYAAARLSDIAARAGLSKTALYLYYPTKADLFRAVLLEHPAIGLANAIQASQPADTLANVLDAMLPSLAAVMSEPKLRRLARMVIAESTNFPELARTWHDMVIRPALGALSSAIAAGQASGIVRPGDPSLMALSVVGPMLAGVIWREVIEPVGGAPIDFEALAASHLTIIKAGLSVQGP